MQIFVIPGWVWINLILLVAAAIFVWGTTSCSDLSTSSSRSTQ